MKHMLIQALVQIRERASKAGNKHFTLGLMLMLMLMPLSVPADNTTLPDYYPEEFTMIGVIDHIDIKRGVIVINDTSWPLSMNARVRTPNTEFSRLLSLRVGMEIGFMMNSINRKLLVAEIWVLPDSDIHSRGIRPTRPPKSWGNTQLNSQ